MINKLAWHGLSEEEVLSTVSLIFNLRLLSIHLYLLSILTKLKVKHVETRITHGIFRTGSIFYGNCVLAVGPAKTTWANTEWLVGREDTIPAIFTVVILTWIWPSSFLSCRQKRIFHAMYSMKNEFICIDWH